jgi:hypothetical protein
MQLFLGLFAPKRLMEQTTSQSLQPEHRSGITVNFLDTPILPTVAILLFGRFYSKKQVCQSISTPSTVPLMRVKGIHASPSKNIFTLRGLYTIKKRKWKETSLA